MNYEESLKILDLIEGAGSKEDEDWQGLYNDLLKDAIDYSNIRAKWNFKTPGEKENAGKSRTNLHDVFISDIEIMARYAKSKGRDASFEEVLALDRKDVGDFACFVHAIIGIRCR
ncbi:MAG: hypothetical protein WC977_04635 [Anaerovoracaceae bacterium]